MFVDGINVGDDGVIGKITNHKRCKISIIHLELPINFSIFMQREGHGIVEGMGSENCLIWCRSGMPQWGGRKA